ncbi:hypothetical protein LJR153_007146 [Paenibacillus sp. LjRoot153]|uniref:hypothetical protein n=1 Tax=Paenibacillus sp. LjRoot153 TaxID=3342270 RepID=UPI003ED13663
MKIKPWTTKELEKMISLSSVYPPIEIARELSRPVASVRLKLRKLGIKSLTDEQWKKNKFQNHIYNEGNLNKKKDNHILEAPKEKNEFESPVLNEFWETLVQVARFAKKRGKSVDVISFIEAYRKIRIDS